MNHKEQAIKHVADKYEEDVEYVSRLVEEGGKSKHQLSLTNAVKNWTVQFYHENLWDTYSLKG